MSIWKQICNTKEEADHFVKMMHSEYTPWKVYPPDIDKYPVTLDIRKLSEKERKLKIYVVE